MAVPYCSFSAYVGPGSDNILHPGVFAVAFDFFFSLFASSVVPLGPLGNPGMAFAISPAACKVLDSSPISYDSSAMPDVQFASSYLENANFSRPPGGPVAFKILHG